MVLGLVPAPVAFGRPAVAFSVRFRAIDSEVKLTVCGLPPMARWVSPVVVTLERAVLPCHPRDAAPDLPPSASMDQLEAAATDSERARDACDGADDRT